MKILKYSRDDGKILPRLRKDIATQLGLHDFEGGVGRIRGETAVFIKQDDLYFFGDVRDYASLKISEEDEEFLNKKGFDCMPHEPINGELERLQGILGRLKTLRIHVDILRDFAGTSRT